MWKILKIFFLPVILFNVCVNSTTISDISYMPILHDIQPKFSPTNFEQSMVTETESIINPHLRTYNSMKVSGLETTTSEVVKVTENRPVSIFDPASGVSRTTELVKVQQNMGQRGKSKRSAVEPPATSEKPKSGKGGNDGSGSSGGCRKDGTNCHKIYTPEQFFTSEDESRQFAKETKNPKTIQPDESVGKLESALASKLMLPKILLETSDDSRGIQSMEIRNSKDIVQVQNVDDDDKKGENKTEMTTAASYTSNKNNVSATFIDATTTTTVKTDLVFPNNLRLPPIM